MAIDHVGEALVGFEALPFEAGAPIVEEAPCPALAPVIPELAEGLLQDVGGAQPLVGGEQELERAFALQGEIVVARQQRVFLTLDEASFLAAETGVLGLAHLVERLAEMAQDVELVEQDRGLRRLFPGDVAERFPHVHYGELDLAALSRPQPGIELRHAGFGAIRAAEPDRPFANQVADHNAIAVALADRDFVDADRLGARRAGTLDLGPHVLHFQCLDRVPVELQFLGDIADRGLRAAAPDIECKTFGEVRIVRQKIQPFALHGAATPARDAPYLEFQNNPQSCTRQVANLPYPTVVPALLGPPATSADRFFERRSRLTIRTSGSPKTPRTVSFGRNPANEYPSDRRRRRLAVLAITHHAKFQYRSKRIKANIHGLFHRYDPSESPTRSPEDPNYMSTYFGITAIQSSQSIFPQFSAGAGVEDINAGLSIVYLLNKHWFIGADASATRFLG